MKGTEPVDRITRQGRFVTASTEILNEWLGRESGTGLFT